MTSLLNIAGNIPVSGVAAGQSLRFEDGDSPYMEKSVDSDGDIKKWTLSFWVKRCELGQQYLFTQTNEDGSGADIKYFACQFTSSDELRFADRWASAGDQYITTTAKFRDPSAWYHVVLVRDSDNATQADRAIIYVNGVRQTVTGSFTQSKETEWNRETVVSYGSEQIGRFRFAGTWYYSADFYLANVCNIDGQALTPTSFGEYEDTLWKPKSDAAIQALTFGTNGFYLPMKQTTEAEGFSTVTYTGNGGTQSIEGVGFEPDFVWIKKRSGSASHVLWDSVRGAGTSTSGTSARALASDLTNAEGSFGGTVEYLSSFNSDGFTVTGAPISPNNANGSGSNYVAWCWDAGTGSAVSNTDGSITSSVKANTANGFSVVSYTSPNNSSDQTVGHGLSQAPDMIICKNRDSSYNWDIYHSGTGNVEETLTFTTAATRNVDAFTTTAPTSTVFGTKNTYTHNGTDDYIAYCFHSVSGYSDIGKWTGTGSSVSVTTGFKPAFLLLKNANDGTASWIIFDSTRSVTDPRDLRLDPDSSNAESTFTNAVDFDSNGFTINATGLSQSGDDYIYMAFADTRDATFFGDTSGNGNNWTPNALNNTDVVPDSPVTNFATLNPLTGGTTPVFSEGNLKVVQTTSTNFQTSYGSFGVASGKWYAEVRVDDLGNNGTQIGVGSYLYSPSSSNQNGNVSGITMINLDNATSSARCVVIDGVAQTGSNSGFSFAVGDIIGVAMDIDSDQVSFYKNNTLLGTGNHSLTSVGGGEFFLILFTRDNSNDTGLSANFGQDSSFAGNETPQGNTDDNGQGDFYYAPPSGFLALTTGNLPTPTITAPDDYFNTVLWTGDATYPRSITGVNFQPNLIWAKARNQAYAHLLQDSVRGTGSAGLYSNSSEAEGYYTDNHNITSFDADGFTLNSTVGTDVLNGSGITNVAWNWLAGGTAVSNTDGSITS